MKFGERGVERRIQHGQVVPARLGKAAHRQDVDIADPPDPAPQDAAMRDQMAAAGQQADDAAAIAVVPRPFAGGGIGALCGIVPDGAQGRCLAAFHAAFLPVDGGQERDMRVIERIQRVRHPVEQVCGSRVGGDSRQARAKLSPVSFARRGARIEIGESRGDQSRNVAARPAAGSPAGGGKRRDPPIDIACLARPFRKGDAVGTDHRRRLPEDRLSGIGVGIWVTIGAGDMIEYRPVRRHRQ